MIMIICLFTRSPLWCQLCLFECGFAWRKSCRRINESSIGAPRIPSGSVLLFRFLSIVSAVLAQPTGRGRISFALLSHHHVAPRESTTLLLPEKRGCPRIRIAHEIGTETRGLTSCSVAAARPASLTRVLRDGGHIILHIDTLRRARRW